MIGRFQVQYAVEPFTRSWVLQILREFLQDPFSLLGRTYCWVVRSCSSVRAFKRPKTPYSYICLKMKLFRVGVTLLLRMEQRIISTYDDQAYRNRSGAKKAWVSILACAAGNWINIHGHRCINWGANVFFVSATRGVSKWARMCGIGMRKSTLYSQTKHQICVPGNSLAMFIQVAR